jgi:sulfur-carrier protein adenylyltransferase/sulfurtransferase
MDVSLPTKKAIGVAVIGAGGTGSQVISGLGRIHTAITRCGHPHGLFVRAYDPAVVTEANVGRQLFHRGDVGYGKAEVLIRRMNLFYGVHWNWVKHAYRSDMGMDLVISCVDSGKAREGISSQVSMRRQYVLDCGNEADFGQVILGGKELGDLYKEYPELTNDNGAPNIPSCSLADALTRQDLFINQAVATHALNIVWQMMRYGRLDYQGVYINLKSGNTNPIKVKSND